MILVDGSEWLYLTFNEFLLGKYINTKIKDTEYLFRIESTNDTANTSVGAFTGCFKIYNTPTQITDSDHYVWFAPDYGPVKIHIPSSGLILILNKINIVN